MHYSLRLNDCLIVGSVQIRVLEVWHDSIKLGISDPKASPAYREEILFIRSDDDGPDETDFAFQPFAIEDFSPFAIPFA